MDSQLKFFILRVYSSSFTFQAQGEMNFYLDSSSRSSDRPALYHKSILGPSGSGKSTFLRWIAGLGPNPRKRPLRAPQAASLSWNQEVWENREQKIFLPVQKRRIGYLAQEYCLFPHLTVGENIAFGLSSLTPKEQKDRTRELLSLIELEGFEERRPQSLSGGQKQRVALARSLAPRPQLLLLDEPFASLDFDTRNRILSELKCWLSELKIPAILATHDPRDAEILGSETWRIKTEEENHFTMNGEVSESLSHLPIKKSLTP